MVHNAAVLARLPDSIVFRSRLLHDMIVCACLDGHNGCQHLTELPVLASMPTGVPS